VCFLCLAAPDTLGHRLGQPGQFGYAVHAVHKTQPGVERAVKVISKARFTRHADIKFHFEQLRSEIKVMQKVRQSRHSGKQRVVVWDATPVASLNPPCLFCVLPLLLSRLQMDHPNIIKLYG
jgi:hypothetical protein